MKVEKSTTIQGLISIEPRRFHDSRGMFFEAYQEKKYLDAGIDVKFVQDNQSISTRGVLRGLHYQVGDHPQAKLVRVTLGEVFDVAVDLRPGSPTFGKWAGYLLTADNMKQLFIPVGFAHGFCVLSETAHFLYKCSDFYSPPDERGIIWNDPDIAIDWPVKSPHVAEKDVKYPRLSEVFDLGEIRRQR